MADQFKTVQNERMLTEIKMTDSDQKLEEIDIDNIQKTDVEVRCVTRSRSNKSKSEIVKSELLSARSKIKELIEIPLQMKIREVPN